MVKEIFSNDITVNIKRGFNDDFYDHYSTDFYDNIEMAKAKTSEVAKNAIDFYAENECISADDFSVVSDEYGNITIEYESQELYISIEIDLRSYSLFSNHK